MKVLQAWLRPAAGFGAEKQLRREQTGCPNQGQWQIPAGNLLHLHVCKFHILLSLVVFHHLKTS
jgi:hypothetical protein